MVKGGKRQGSGRPQGTGKFGESTKAIRVPVSEVENVFKLIENAFYRLPFYETVSAGFPSTADSFEGEKLDLNELLIKHPAATFFLRVSGSSMIKAGIHHNDILIVDRSLEPTHGKIVIAALNGELTVKRLYRHNNVIRLMPENDDYQPIEVKREMDLHIWGVVTNVIHPC